MPSDGKYAGLADWPEVERDHAAVITYLDGYVGELIKCATVLGHHRRQSLIVAVYSSKSLMMAAC